MAKPVLAIDIDEVLFPFIAKLLEHTNTKYGLDHSIEQVKDFNLGFWNVADSEAIDRVHDVLRLDHNRVHAIDGAKLVISCLQEKYLIYIVTSRDEEFRARTEEWLTQHFAGLYDGLYITGNHYSGREFRSKAEVCIELGVEMLIDDQLHHARESSQLGLPCILFGDYPWNQTDALPDGVVRARDWAEVRELLMEVPDEKN